MHIVLDAIDECPERDRLLTLLDLIHGWGIDSLHLLVTSRKERDIEDKLNPLASHHVPMDGGLVKGDIRLHVIKMLDHDIKFQMCSRTEKNNIENVSIEGAHGM